MIDITRRKFLQGTAYGLSALMLPGMQCGPNYKNRTLVVIFLRGGSDGLNLVVPQGDPSYSAGVLRQSIALPNNPAMALDTDNGGDGFFQFHPGMAPAKALYDAGDLAVVHACGNTKSYSHFHAQCAMERVSPDDPNVLNGWLHKTVNSLVAAQGAQGAALSLSGISLASRKAVSMAGVGASASIAFPSVADFEFSGVHAAESQTALEAVYAGLPLGPVELRGQDFVKASGDELFTALSEVDGVASTPVVGDYTGVHPVFAARLQDAAKLIKEPGLGVRIVAIDWAGGGGWDTHQDQVARMDISAPNLANGLRAFYEDLAGHEHRVVTLAMTEFGRTAFENGNAGTDHGWGTTLFAAGGGIAGGRVLTQADPTAPLLGLPAPNLQHWPGLGPGELHNNSGNRAYLPLPYSPGERDLKATTDFRDVFAEVLRKHMGLPQAEIDANILNHTSTFPGLYV